MSVRSIGAILSYRAYPTGYSTTAHVNMALGGFRLLQNTPMGCRAGVASVFKTFAYVVVLVIFLATGRKAANNHMTVLPDQAILASQDDLGFAPIGTSTVCS
jgi:hypothetical protein